MATLSSAWQQLENILTNRRLAFIGKLSISSKNETEKWPSLQNLSKSMKFCAAFVWVLYIWSMSFKYDFLCVYDRIMYLAIAAARYCDSLICNWHPVQVDRGTHIKSYVSISEYYILTWLIVHPIWSKAGYLSQQ